jgi:hypothetical protein
MLSHVILAVISGTAVPGVPSVPAWMMTFQRSVPVQLDCVGRRRIVSAPPRVKKEVSRKRCRVVAPILM